MNNMAYFGIIFPRLTLLISVFSILVSGNLRALSFKDINEDGKEKSVEQTVSINLNQSVFTVSKKFLSVAITVGLIREHWPHINFTSEKFFTLAKGLSPAFLRVGGTAEDFLIYDDSPGLNKHKNFTNFTITHEDLDKIHLLSSKANWDVLFGLNVLLREKDGSWNASNPKKIMQYVADSGYHFGWELGNGNFIPGRGGGGGTAIYGLYRYVPCKGYGFQAVYSRIGYINQSVWL